MKHLFPIYGMCSILWLGACTPVATQPEKSLFTTQEDFPNLLNVKNVPAVIPDAETLAKFSDFCAPIFAQQRILEEQNQSLATLRDNLLPKLMSGEIDVSAVQL